MPEIEESKILEFLKSYSGGIDMRQNELSLAQARTEEHIRSMDDKIAMLSSSMAQGFRDVKEQIEKLDGKFAGKLTERIVYFTCGVFGLALLTAFSIVVFPHKAQAAAIFLLNITS